MCAKTMACPGPEAYSGQSRSVGQCQCHGRGHGHGHVHGMPLAKAMAEAKAIARAKEAMACRGHTKLSSRPGPTARPTAKTIFMAKVMPEAGPANAKARAMDRNMFLTKATPACP